MLRILPAELHYHVTYLIDAMDEVDFQFLLCELSKVIAFILTNSPIYLRSYWANHISGDEDF